MRGNTSPHMDNMFQQPPPAGPYYGATPQLEEGYSKVPQRIIDTRYSIAYLSTVAQLVVYCGPVIIGIDLGHDPDAAFWIGRFGFVCVLVPVVIIILHVMHLILLKIGRPSKIIFLLMALLPGGIICYTGSAYSGDTDLLYGILMSEDCTKHRGLETNGWQMQKHNLQAAYEKAAEVLAECRSLEVAVEKAEYALDDIKRQRATLSSEPTLLNCQDWAVHGHMHDEIQGWTAWAEKTIGQKKRYRDEFNYLASVEANQFCGGFCDAGPMLWMDYDLAGTRAGHGGRHAACAPIVAGKLRAINREAKFLFWLGVGCMIFLVVCFYMAKPLLEYLGYRTNPWMIRDN